MSNVFIAGSRNLSRLNPDVTGKMKEMMSRNAQFLVGDANGADKALQAFLAQSGYRQVTVYYAGACRNNLGSWPSEQVETANSKKSFAFYAAKDSAMAQEADCGFMLWDGKSKGTLNNIEVLVGMGKKTLVYFSPERSFITLTSAQELEELLSHCDKEAIEKSRTEIRRKLPDARQLNLTASM